MSARTTIGAFVLWFVASLCPASGAQTEVVFVGLKQVYHSGETIVFTVKSISPNKLLFYCVAEIKNGNRWVETGYSIDEFDGKQVMVTPLKPGQNRQLVWKPSKLPPGKPHLLRLKALVYNGPVDDEHQGGVSNSFTIR